MSAAAAPPTEAWSRYWAGGATHSCADAPQAGPGTYGGAIGAFWRTAFGELEAPARILDIGCGNGALARLLLATRPGENIGCDAIDLAAVAPDWAANEPRVRFHAGVAAEALPFDDGRFDLVASQYGIEYSALDRSLPEALRVSRRGGQLRLAMHHVDSRPCRLAHEELGHLAWLLAEQGWLDAATEMLEPLHLMNTAKGQSMRRLDTIRFDAIRKRFDALTAELHARRSASVCPDVLADAHNAAVQAFRVASQQGPSAGQVAMQSLRRWLADIRSRLQDMTTHALDDARMSALADALRASGADGQWQALHDRDALMAVALRVDAGR